MLRVGLGLRLDLLLGLKASKQSEAKVEAKAKTPQGPSFSYGKFPGLQGNPIILKLIPKIQNRSPNNLL